MRYLIDFTDIYLSNKNSGIQRVVKNIYRNFKQQNINVHAVFLSNGKIYTFDLDNLNGNKKNKSTSITSILNYFLTKLVERFPYKLIYYLQWMKLELKRKRNISKSPNLQITKSTGNDILILADSSWGMNMWKSLEEAKNNDVKIITIIYDLIPINYPHLVRTCYTKIFIQWLNKLYELSDSFICISETVKNELTEYYKNNNYEITSKYFSSFKLGCDFKQSNYDLINIRQVLINMFNNKSTYLIVSTIEPRKNHNLLLDTFTALWDKGFDIQLCIVGKDSGKCPYLISRITNNKQLHTKLFWFDDINDDELIYCYNNSKALIFSSIVEGFGLPIVESLNFGLPVLASDIPVHKEVGKDMIDYFNIDNSNELVKMIEDIESGKRELKRVDAEKVHITNWKESAEDLLSKIFLT